MYDMINIHEMHFHKTNFLELILHHNKLISALSVEMYNRILVSPRKMYLKHNLPLTNLLLHTSTTTTTTVRSLGSRV